MGKVSKIQWTDATWNPWHGCKKVSPGCKFCYMYRDKDRYGQDPTMVLRSKTKFNDPLKWSFDMQVVKHPVPSKRPKVEAFPGMKIFTCSWSDWFIEEADEWRPEAWEIIKNTPEFTYQILTKRPGRIRVCLPPDWGDGYENVWLGVSVESQAQTGRISQLANVPAKVRFASFEPLIGEIRDAWLRSLDWAIIGGESGNETGKYRYRECKEEWITPLIQHCRDANTPVFVKQLGTHLAKEMRLKDRHGGNMDEWPAYLQVRQMPKVKNLAT